MNETLNQQPPSESIAPEPNLVGFDSLTQERELAERVKEKTHYAGLFVDREALYQNAPAHLEHTVEYPHVTTKFAPEISDLHLDSLGSDAKIIAIGYGNNGKNEGLLVRVEASDPVIQEAINKLRNPHITLSCSEGSHSKDTVDLDFTTLKEDEQFELQGTYCLHMKNNRLVDSHDDFESL